MANDMDTHEVRFEWPQTGPKSVIVTGTFDQWSSTRQLTKTATGFVGTTRIPWNQKILFKYIVDGNWALVHGRPTEVERGTGFVNHVYYAPPKPQVIEPTEPASKPEPVIADDAVASTPDIPTTKSASEVVTTLITKESLNEPAAGSSAAPIAAEGPGSSLRSAEPVHVDVGDAKSDSGTTAVADPELTADIINAPLESPEPSGQKREPETAEKKANNKLAPLPTTPSKGEVFPSVSPPSSPSRFGSLRGSGKKKRTSSFFAKLKEVFKSDKEKETSKKEKGGIEN